MAQDTRQRILDTARALFNAQGLHRVGVRDIARATEMSPGNLAYHFPTKDELVKALVMELHELNARSLFRELPEDFSLFAFYATAVGALTNILGYRFVVLSYAEAVPESDELMALEAKLQIGRRRRSDVMLAKLIEGDWIVRKVLDAEHLHEQGEMVSSGWLRAASLRPGWKNDRQIVLHYAKVGVALLEPFCTPRGARQMRRILAGERDHGA